ncbi:hypothetical protein SLA2020_439660 [Shorea laevis]
MQQRSSSSSSRAVDEWCAINIPHEPQAKHSPKRRTDDMGGLLIHDLHRGFVKRQILRMKRMWIHAIPLIVLICFLVLWWFSYPVNLVIKDSKITAIHEIEMPMSLNDTDDIDVAILAAAISSPIASVPLNLTSNNETEAPPPASKSDCRTFAEYASFSFVLGHFCR